MGKYSFQKGYGQVKKDDLPKVKKEIMEALNIKTIPSWYNRINGHVIPTMPEAEAIEAVFAKYGIKKIWG